jgi:hypothetical protein
MCGHFNKTIKEFEVRLLPENEQLPPEARRVLVRFALVVMAGSIASKAGLIDWSEDEIFTAACHVRDLWLSGLGDVRSEQDRAMAHIRDEITRKQSRIVWLNRGGSVGSGLIPDTHNKSNDILGYRTEDAFGFIPAGFREICGEYDEKMVRRALIDAGLLVHDKPGPDGKRRYKKRWGKIEGQGRPQLYTIRIEFMGESDGDDEDPF